MPRPRSIFERFTTPVIPPPEDQEKLHLVKQDEHAIQIANLEYDLKQYDKDLWREILIRNGVENPLVLDAAPSAGGYLGLHLSIPARPLPEFTA
jgi:hypothetical protein